MPNEIHVNIEQEKEGQIVKHQTLELVENSPKAHEGSRLSLINKQQKDEYRNTQFLTVSLLEASEIMDKKKN